MPIQPPPTPDEFHATATRLGLTVDGPPGTTAASIVGPVHRDDVAGYLKMTHEKEEITGGRALQWWEGDGAAKVLQSDGNAVVLERLGAPLRAVVTDDRQATTIICDVIARIHSHSHRTLPDGFPPLRAWMQSLFADTGPRFDTARSFADDLLTRNDDPVLLHGDVHHENVLDGGERGWLLIDPKGILGPRAFDYANLFTNWTLPESLQHFDSRLEIVTRRSGINRFTTLQWIVAWSALSGIWHLEEGNTEEALHPHSIMALALDRLS